ncbi:MAG: T9SS type A sorting domain-containing protein [Flavobacteriales bacterium]
MNKKSTLTLSLFAFFSVGVLNAQIVYTDITPDVVLSNPANPTYLVDLDNNMTNDFAISVQPVNEVVSGVTVTGHASGIFSLNAGSEFIAAEDGLLPIMLVTNFAHQSMIDASGDFTTGTPDIEGGVLRGVVNAPLTYPMGNFSNAVNAFIGVKIEESGNTYYGWIRVDVDANGTQTTVKDYAYESTAGEGIQAGRDNNGNWVSVIENDLANSLNLIVTSENIRVTEITGKTIQAEIYSIEGKRLLNKTFTGSDVIYFDGLAMGVYTARFSAENGVFTQKFFVK